MTADFISDISPVLQPTSSVGDITVATDTARLDISLWMDASQFYAVSLYAYDGKVTINDVGSLIEYQFRKKGYSIHQVTIKVNAPGVTATLASKVMTCLYCEYNLPVSSFSGTFLSLLNVQRTHIGSIVSLATDNPEELAAATLTAVGSAADGSAASKTITLAAVASIASGAYHCHVSVDDIISELASLSPKITDLRYFTVDAADRQKTFYIDRHTDYMTLCFRNIFNFPEYIDIPGVTVTTTEVSRSDASLSGITTQYDTSTLRSYKVTTAPLMRSEAEAFPSIIESSDISIRLGKSDFPIIITDHTIEVSDDNAELNTMQFTWRFPDSRPRLFGSSLDPLLSGSDRIFTQEFTHEYQ